MLDKRIEALKSATERKKQDALLKTEKAIETLIRENHKITIRSVAREAEVSASYIYKYPELTYRIQTLREQQKYNRVKPQAPSSKSHQIISTQLRNRIKIVEQEKAELSQEIKILATSVNEMSKSENSVERLKAQNIELIDVNKNLKKQLRQYEQEICELRDLILQQGYINRHKFSDLNYKNSDR
jgi:hypothetical protein